VVRKIPWHKCLLIKQFRWKGYKITEKASVRGKRPDQQSSAAFLALDLTRKYCTI